MNGQPSIAPIDESGFHRAAALAAEALQILAATGSGSGNPAPRLKRLMKPPLDSPGRTAERAAYLNRLKKEHVLAIYVNARNREVASETVSIGTLTASLIHPREVFAPAIACLAAGVLVIHNHPSGNSEPSSEDREITRRLVRAGDILGIPLIDHVIVSEGGYYSFREHALL